MKLLLGVAFIAAVAAVPTPPHDYILHEERTHTPREWRREQRVDGEAILPIRIGLKQENLENAYGHLMDVSDPNSPNYGKFWKAEDVYAMYAPDVEAVSAIMGWLESVGVEDVVHSDNKVSMTEPC